MANSKGLAFEITRHARDRYLVQYPDGPGIVAELASAKTATRKQYKLIRRTCQLHASQGRVSRGANGYTHWVSNRGNVFVTTPASDLGVMVVISCWPLAYGPQTARAARILAQPTHECGGT